jgi:hypothetical protein
MLRFTEANLNRARPLLISVIPQCIYFPGLPHYSSRMMKTFLVLALVTLLSAACSRPQDIKVPVAISAPGLLKDMQVELLADGAPAPLLRTDENLRNSFLFGRIFEIHAVVEGEKKTIPALKLRVLFGCGWREQALTLQANADFLRAAAAGRLDPPYVQLELQPFPGSSTNIWVDNRAGGPAELGLGAIKVPVPAGKVTPVQVATCDTSFPVSFDGVRLGEVRAYNPSEASSTIVLDPSGKRCYTLYTVQYRLQYERNIPGGHRGGSELLSGKRLYRTEKIIQYPFVKPPETVTASHRGADVSVTALDDAQCK